MSAFFFLDGIGQDGISELQSHSISYRIAVGPRKGQKALTKELLKSHAICSFMLNKLRYYFIWLCNVYSISCFLLWKSLKAIDSPTINRLLVAKLRLENANNPLSFKIQKEGYDSSIKLLCSQQKLFSKVEKIAPNLAESFKEISSPTKVATIDWRTGIPIDELKKIKNVDDKGVKYFVRHIEGIKKVTDPLAFKKSIKIIDDIALSISKKAKVFSQIKKIAPTIANTITLLAKIKAKERYRGRDRVDIMFLRAIAYRAIRHGGITYILIT